MLKHLTDPPVAYVVEIPEWVVAVYAVLAPFLLPLAGVGIGFIALGGQAIVRHHRARRQVEDAGRVPAGADN